MATPSGDICCEYEDDDSNDNNNDNNEDEDDNGSSAIASNSNSSNSNIDGDAGRVSSDEYNNNNNAVSDESKDGKDKGSEIEQEQTPVVVVMTPPPHSIKIPMAPIAAVRSKKIPIVRRSDDFAQFAMMSKSDPEDAENVHRLRAKAAAAAAAANATATSDDSADASGIAIKANGVAGAGADDTSATVPVAGEGKSDVRKTPVPVTLKSPRGMKKTVSSCRAKFPKMATLNPVEKKVLSDIKNPAAKSEFSEWQEKETEFKNKRYNPTDAFKMDFEVVRMLGDGATSRVMLARKKSTGEVVAIKAIPIDFMGRKEEFKKIAKEIPILKRLSHRNIIRYHDVIFSELYMYIVLE